LLPVYVVPGVYNSTFPLKKILNGWGFVLFGVDIVVGFRSHILVAEEIEKYNINAAKNILLIIIVSAK